MSSVRPHIITAIPISARITCYPVHLSLETCKSHLGTMRVDWTGMVLGWEGRRGRGPGVGGEEGGGGGQVLTRW